MKKRVLSLLLLSLTSYSVLAKDTQYTFNPKQQEKICGFQLATPDLPMQLIAIQAEQGNVWAQNKLGQQFSEGPGLKNPEEAARWTDFFAAERWLTMAAISGCAYYQTNLADLYSGTNYPAVQELAKALVWYQKAALQGYDVAQLRLGDRYFLGEGTDKNDQHAFFWYEQAAAQNNTCALRQLGRMYLFGMGVESNPKKAKQTLEKLGLLLAESYNKAHSDYPVDAKKLSIMYAEIELDHLTINPQGNYPILPYAILPLYEEMKKLEEQCRLRVI